jgi:hypothetical protein
MRFTSSYLKTQHNRLYVLEGHLKDGQQGYFLFLVDPGKQRAFEEAVQASTAPCLDIDRLFLDPDLQNFMEAVDMPEPDFGRFGKVVTSGYGAPTREDIEPFIAMV